jgi:tricorn protease interacting factor F2/3
LIKVIDYDISIDLDFRRLNFTGLVRIALKTDQDVILNSVGLKILQVSSDKRTFPFSQRGEDLVVETGPFDEVLEVEFAGAVADSLSGIYKAPYDHTHIVTTHFEAAEARRMFPCVDRPEAKATFKLSVGIDKDLEAISNMPVESVEPDGEKKRVTFQKTPRMSTYLLYLGVGKFQERIEKVGRTAIVLATTPGKTKLGKIAQDEARKALQYLETYFAIPFALPKVHLVAVPEFAEGAMENWGAITFREVRLLVDANTTSKMLTMVSQTVAHELAHQWFGDLVTMRWWDDIWLNESFATFMTYRAVDSFHPEWHVWENIFNGQPKVETLADAMGRDSLKSTHPIHVPVNSPDEIAQIFDAVSYGKGCHVLRMVENYVGEEAFRAGVRNYLSTYSYGNATKEDFWASLEAASGKEVTRLMSQWISQPGYPLLTASYNNGWLRLQQERFLISGNSDETLWPIPVTIEMNGERRSILMEKPEENIEARSLQSLKINPDRTGFYSVRYVGLDDYVWRSNLSPFDKWGLIFDRFSFLVAGKITFSDYLATINRFSSESDTLPAQEASDEIALLYAMVPNKLADFSKNLHRSLLTVLQDKTDERSSNLRGIVAARLAFVEEEYASQLCSGFRDYSGVAPDMRRAVAIAYARSTNDLEGLLDAYRASVSDEDKTSLLQATTQVTDTTVLQKALEFTLSGEVKRQDILSPLYASTDNPLAKDVVWSWLKENVEKLQAVYVGTGRMSNFIQHTIPILAIGRIREVESFFASQKIPDIEAGVRVGLERSQAYERLVRTIMQDEDSLGRKET